MKGCSTVEAYQAGFLFFTTGLVAGAIDAIAGGGGLITVPVLLASGLPPQLALGTNKLQSCCGTAIATFTYYRQGWLKSEGLLRGIIFSATGAAFGALAMQLSSHALLKQLIPISLLFVLSYLVFCPHLGRQDDKPKINLNLFYPVVGLALGFYDGFLGPGVGGFWVFLLMYLLGYNLLKATAYTKVYNLNTNLVALLCFAAYGKIDYRIGLIMACGQLLGGRLGAHFAMKKGFNLIRPLFLLMMFVAILTLIYRNHSTWHTLYQFGFALVFFGITIFYVWKIKKQKPLAEDS